MGRKRENDGRSNGMARSMQIGDQTIWYYDEGDIAPCRKCGIKPDYRKGSGNSGDYIRCPGCGIKTGTSTSGLEGLIPTWNAIMDDGWPANDPKGDR